MSNERKTYVWLNKGYGGHKTHMAKRGMVKWSSGDKTEEWLPACGQRIDVCALENDTRDPGPDYCKKCFPDKVVFPDRMG